MAKFRLLMCRQKGEQIAREYGFTSFPIDPFEIAKKEEIKICPKPPDKKGVSGGIVFSGNNAGIFYATDIVNEGFRRFTVGHELGHYFIDGHPEQIQKSAPLHVSRAGFSQGDNSIEIEADHFASGLLLPTYLVHRSLRNAAIGLEGVISLSDDSICSLTASAIRAAECSEYPVAVVVSQGDKVCYCFQSDGFKRLGGRRFLRKGTPLPDSATKEFNRSTGRILSGARHWAESDLSTWFDGSPQIKLDEEIIGLGSYGFTLTVFSSESIPSDPDVEDDDEERLIESWTPKFAYGR